MIKLKELMGNISQVKYSFLRFLALSKIVTYQCNYQILFIIETQLQACSQKDTHSAKSVLTIFPAIP